MNRRDRFYAHMDEEAAEAHRVFPGRVAHGDLLLAFAAGLFVEPARRFLKPVTRGEAIRVRLTVKQKAKRTADYGEAPWDVEIAGRGGRTGRDL